MNRRKKAGWGYCRDCYRAYIPSSDSKFLMCEEQASNKTPPCLISTLSTHLKFEKILHDMEEKL